MLRKFANNFFGERTRHELKTDFNYGRNIAVPFYAWDIEIDDEWKWVGEAKGSSVPQMCANAVTVDEYQDEEEKGIFFRLEKVQVATKSLATEVYYGTADRRTYVIQTLLYPLVGVNVIPPDATTYSQLFIYRAKGEIPFWAKMEALRKAVSSAPTELFEKEGFLKLPFSGEEIEFDGGDVFDLVIAHHPDTFKAMPMIIFKQLPNLSGTTHWYNLNTMKRVMFDILAHYFLDGTDTFEKCMEKLLAELDITGIPDLEMSREVRIKNPGILVGKKRSEPTTTYSDVRKEWRKAVGKSFAYRYADLLFVYSSSFDTLPTQEPDSEPVSSNTRNASNRRRGSGTKRSRSRTPEMRASRSRSYEWFLYKNNTYAQGATLSLIKGRLQEDWVFAHIFKWGAQPWIGRDYPLNLITTLIPIAARGSYDTIARKLPTLLTTDTLATICQNMVKSGPSIAMSVAKDYITGRPIDMWTFLDRGVYDLFGLRPLYEGDTIGTLIYSPVYAQVVDSLVRSTVNYTRLKNGYAPLMFTGGNVAFELYSSAKSYIPDSTTLCCLRRVRVEEEDRDGSVSSYREEESSSDEEDERPRSRRQRGRHVPERTLLSEMTIGNFFRFCVIILKNYKAVPFIAAGAAAVIHWTTGFETLWLYATLAAKTITAQRTIQNEVTKLEVKQSQTAIETFAGHLGETGNEFVKTVNRITEELQNGTTTGEQLNTTASELFNSARNVLRCVDTKLIGYTKDGSEIFQCVVNNTYDPDDLTINVNGILDKLTTLPKHAWNICRTKNPNAFKDTISPNVGYGIGIICATGEAAFNATGHAFNAAMEMNNPTTNQVVTAVTGWEGGVWGAILGFSSTSICGMIRWCCCCCGRARQAAPRVDNLLIPYRPVRLGMGRPV